jgi:uncharacterized membrane protein YdjX (TVP38/TMEM64 family)
MLHNHGYCGSMSGPACTYSFLCLQGVIFGTAQGTIITSLSGTVAAAIAFLIARYAMRDRVRHVSLATTFHQQSSMAECC